MARKAIYFLTINSVIVHIASVPMLFSIIKYSKKRQRRRKLRRLKKLVYYFFTSTCRHFKRVSFPLCFSSPNSVSPADVPISLDNGIHEKIIPDMYRAVASSDGNCKIVKNDDNEVIIIDDYCNMPIVNDNIVYLFPNEVEDNFERSLKVDSMI